MKEKLILGGVILAIIIGGAALFGGSGSDGRDGKDGRDGVGAVASLQSPLEVNGVATYYEGKALRIATTTVCSIKSPVATSTLTHASLRLAVSSTTASKVYIAKGATMNATTTNFVTFSVAADAQITINATTTALEAGDNNIFAPSQYLNFGMSGGNSTFSPVGKCVATFIEN